MDKDQKKVIMQIVPALENGGVERGVVDIAKCLKNNNFLPIVISNGGVLVYDLTEAGINHIKLAVNTKNPIKIYNNIKKIEAIIKKFNVDIVHVRSRAPMLTAYYACKRTNTKLISTVHGIYSLNFLFWKNFSLKKKYNSLMLKADSVIAVSNFVKKYLLENYLGDFSSKIKVIQRGADLNYFNLKKVSNNRIIDLIKKWNLPEDKKIILMPARYTSWKGHEFLISALSKVNNDFFCIMVGSDHGHEKYHKKLEQMVVQKNLESKIRLVGPCKDMPAAYALSHFVVAPSIRPEAFGRIAIEAQASQKPIIATAIGGSLETIINNETGFLVDVLDVDNLTIIIDKVLQMSKQEIDQIGLAGRKNIEENFSNQKMCDETVGLYSNFLQV